MGALTSYAIEVAIVLAVEYLIYKLALAGTTLYRFNRGIIIGCYILALLAVPLLHLLSNVANTSNANDIVAFGKPIATITEDSETLMLWEVIPIVYFLGVALMFLWTELSYLKLFKLMRSGEIKTCSEYTIILLDKEISPFSWGHYIIVSKNDAHNNLVLTHELTHIRQHHTVDLFFAQLFVIFNWFNPAAYLMRDELSAVQEYEADEQVLLSGVNAKEYQMLLIKKTVGAGFQAIANSLNHSQLKNRLTMMTKTKSKSARRLVAAVMLPVAIVAASMTDIPAVAAVIQNVGAVNYGKVNEFLSDSQMNAVTSETTSGRVSDSKVVENPDVLPEFKGGEMEMYKILIDNTSYPKDAAEAKAQGKTVVQFVVNTNGTISNVDVLNSSGNASLDAEAIRVIKECLSTGWTPGKEDGQLVACKMAIPVMFRLK